MKSSTRYEMRLTTWTAPIRSASRRIVLPSRSQIGEGPSGSQTSRATASANAAVRTCASVQATTAARDTAPEPDDEHEHAHERE